MRKEGDRQRRRSGATWTERGEERERQKGRKRREDRGREKRRGES